MPIEDVIGQAAWPPRPRGVRALDLDMGAVAGHRLWIRSIEDWGDWMDVRVARVAEDPDQPLPRRLPPPSAWAAHLDGLPITVADAVGRGDRRFSDGELRLRPGLSDEPSELRLRVTLLDGADPLEVTIPLG